MNIWELVALIFGSGGAIVTAVGGLFNYLMKRSENRTKEDLQLIKNNTANISELEQKIDIELKDINKNIDICTKHIDTFYDINGVLYSNSIKEEIKRYLCNGFITYHELEHLNKMSSIYFNKLNGNGSIKDLIKLCRELPVKEKETQHNDYKQVSRKKLHTKSKRKQKNCKD